MNLKSQLNISFSNVLIIVFLMWLCRINKYTSFKYILIYTPLNKLINSFISLAVTAKQSYIVKILPQP